MPAFALDLDPDGLRLFRKDGDAWTSVDEVALDDPALSRRLREMREKAEEISGGSFETDLVIPPSQILYTSVQAPSGGRTVEQSDVACALEGLTPCPVEELVYDWRHEGDEIRIAALDINTLDEAESFAAKYGFNPARFTAWPDPAEFPESPDFGTTQFARHRPPDPEGAVFVSRRSQAEPATAPQTAPPAADPVPTAPPRPPTPVAAPTRAPHRPERTLVRPDRGVVKTAVAAMVIFGGLVWLAIDLVTPRGPNLPEVAETPELQQENQVAEVRLAPSRLPPELASDEPLPAIPPTGDELLTEMADRQTAEIFVGTAPDPETEVGVLDSADMWQTPPPPLIEPVPDSVDTLYLAAIDPVLEIGDAFALSDPADGHDGLDKPPLPPQPGEAFELDERGLVVATAEGALTPDGVVVTAGPPPLRSRPRPTTAVLIPDPDVALALAGKKPRQRPNDLVERMERSQFGGRTLAELSAMTPKPRPESPQQVAAAPDEPPSRLAVAVSRAPSYRPNDFASIVAATQQARAAKPSTDTAVVAAATAAVTPSRPTIPSSASVARQATIENAINLGRLNLIGVYGSAADRRALIRLPSGRFVKVKVGDRVDGGQVAAIGDNELRYVKGGKNHTLKVPSS